MIDRETVKKNAYLPVKLSELSRINPDAALKLLQDWGDGKKPIKVLWEETLQNLETSKTLVV